jgi:hypothetical protein
VEFGAAIDDERNRRHIGNGRITPTDHAIREIPEVDKIRVFIDARAVSEAYFRVVGSRKRGPK